MQINGRRGFANKIHLQERQVYIRDASFDSPFNKKVEGSEQGESSKPTPSTPAPPTPASVETTTELLSSMVSLVSLSSDQLAGAHATQVHSSPEDMEFNRIKTTYANMNGDFAPEAMASTYLSATPSLDTAAFSLASSAEAAAIDANFEVVDGTTIFFDAPPQTSDSNDSSKNIEATAMSDLKVVVTEVPQKADASTQPPKTEKPAAPLEVADLSMSSPPVDAKGAIPEVEKTSPQAFNEAPSTAPPTNPSAVPVAPPKVEASLVNEAQVAVEPTAVESEEVQDASPETETARDPEPDPKLEKEVTEQVENLQDVAEVQETDAEGKDVVSLPVPEADANKDPEYDQPKEVKESDQENEVETGPDAGSDEKSPTSDDQTQKVDDQSAPESSNAGNEVPETTSDAEAVIVDDQSDKEVESSEAKVIEGKPQAEIEVPQPDLKFEEPEKPKPDKESNEEVHELVLDFKKDGHDAPSEHSKDQVTQPPSPDVSHAGVSDKIIEAPVTEEPVAEKVLEEVEKKEAVTEKLGEPELKLAKVEETTSETVTEAPDTGFFGNFFGSSEPDQIPTSTEAIPVEPAAPSFENPSVITETVPNFDQTLPSFSSDEIKFYEPGQVPENFASTSAPGFEEARTNSDLLSNNLGKVEG